MEDLGGRRGAALKDSLVGVFEGCADSHDAGGLVDLVLGSCVEYFGRKCRWFGECNEVLTGYCCASSRVESGWWWWSFIRHLGNLSLLALTPMRLEAFAQLVFTAKATRVDRLRLFMAHRLSHYLKHETLAFIVPLQPHARRYCLNRWQKSGPRGFVSLFGGASINIPHNSTFPPCLNQILINISLNSNSAQSSFTSTPCTAR